MLLAGCVALMPAPAPLRTVAYESSQQPAKCLFVLLPGAGDPAERFRDQGVVRRPPEQRPINRHPRNRRDDRLLHEGNAGRSPRGRCHRSREGSRGYQEIWLVGPSMGGLGSLLYSRVHSADVTGVLVIAPFLGDRDLIEEIAAAGTLNQWQAPPRVDTMSRDNYQRELWRWLRPQPKGVKRRRPSSWVTEHPIA